MKKKIVITLWVSLVVLLIVFGTMLVSQYKKEAAAEQARIEKEQEELRIAEEEAAAVFQQALSILKNASDSEAFFPPFLSFKF